MREFEVGDLVRVVGPGEKETTDDLYYWRHDRMDDTIGMTLRVRKVDSGPYYALDANDQDVSEDMQDMLHYYRWMPEWLELADDPACEQELAALLL